LCTIQMIIVISPRGKQRNTRVLDYAKQARLPPLNVLGGADPIFFLFH
jgi:hypothetical protein